jgi:tetrahydromethanopterin S-methyltransferase subunit D
MFLVSSSIALMSILLITISGIIGAALGGIGGSLIYYVLMGLYSPLITTSASAVAGELYSRTYLPVLL